MRKVEAVKHAVSSGFKLLTACLEPHRKRFRQSEGPNYYDWARRNGRNGDGPGNGDEWVEA